jgi:hypothetical protein
MIAEAGGLGMINHVNLHTRDASAWMHLSKISGSNPAANLKRMNEVAIARAKIFGV